MSNVSPKSSIQKFPLWLIYNMNNLKVGQFRGSQSDARNYAERILKLRKYVLKTGEIGRAHV